MKKKLTAVRTYIVSLSELLLQAITLVDWRIPAIHEGNGDGG